jgi:hypothetical protein
LDQEKSIVKKEPKATKRCCGNSPDKSHHKNHGRDHRMESPEYRQQIYRAAHDRSYKPYVCNSSAKKNTQTFGVKRPMSAKPLQASPSKGRLNDDQIAKMAM